MAFFKCKMCGGELDISDTATVIECDYCGSKQTLPKSIDENMQNLFNRATSLRIKGEFDKAEKIYERIIQSDGVQAEAYWGLILCKYGIEYVNDPKTLKKIPTCHRASYDSIIADDDYKSALANADISQRSLYEEQAKEIDRIQKEILALAQKEEKYDVFICYKETDADGQRTHDSTLANDIYYQLTNRGFKVFYAAITLEGKLGSAYEPIIFAALNSAKVMLVVGTKPEYFHAVWVKNEWSRFLKIIKKDRSKILIPCYRNMDPYDLPEEFAHLQAQDMSKIGFINDIEQGVAKIIKKDSHPSSATNSATVQPLLKRINLFLETKEWDNANTYCEKVLDMDPENAQAYIGKLLAQLKISQENDLNSVSSPINQLPAYKMAIRFADDTTAQRLKQYNDNINAKIAQQKAEEERREQERREKERLEKERIEKERIEKERIEKERIERQRKEKEQQERERLQKEQLKAIELEKEQLKKSKLQEEKDWLFDKISIISDNLDSLQQKKAELNTKSIEIQSQLEFVKKKTKAKKYATIVFRLCVVFYSTMLFVLFLGLGGVMDNIDPVMSAIAGTITGIVFLVILVLSGFMFSANGKPSALAILSYFTLGILPLIYSRIVINQCKNINLIDCEAKKYQINNEIKKTETDISNAQKDLTAAKEELNNFIQTRIN